MEPLVLQRFPSLNGVVFSEQWELLRPTFEHLYVQEKWKLPDIVRAFKEHGFDASESQYKYQIKKWKIKKILSTQKKEGLSQVLQKRAQLGKLSTIKRAGQEFDAKNFRRYLKTERRRAITLQPGIGEATIEGRSLSERITLSGNRIFMNWNMPYGIMRSSEPRAVEHLSPLSDIDVATPPSPHDAPSPMTLAVRQMTAIEKARLFVQGKQMALLHSLENPQRITLSTWMYQYWLFAYKTAKHWGRGPQNWTAEMLDVIAFHQGTTISMSSPNTPAAITDVPASQPTLDKDQMNILSPHNARRMPSSLCRWSIHCRAVSYVPVPSPPRSPARDFDLDDERSWPPWPQSHKTKEFTEKLSEGLENNDFSSVKADDLPIATDLISKAARKSPKVLLEEALGFSIMSRNAELMDELLAKAKKERVSVAGLYPCHLAVAYLDGSKTCCNILHRLLRHIWLMKSVRELFINDFGHTILDQLMITILKAHTSCSPGMVDVVFRKEKRFEGEDVDICGRWDADSGCVRSLLANGRATIPFEWKHMFCHTSIQTICHCIEMLEPWLETTINTPSGLFVRHCSHCGLKLQMFPLHTLVLVGVHLSRFGCENENLFGILACLLCLLSNGADPSLKANISVQDLLGTDQVDGCTHEELDAAQLAEKACSILKMTWSEELISGWQVLFNVITYSQAVWEAETSEGYRGNKCYMNFFGTNTTLASLWAAVQTELLTYRRLEEGDCWISPNFNMRSLMEGLIGEGKADIALVQNAMMKPFCDCGRFVDSEHGHVSYPVVDDVVAYYFSNLEDWNRTTFISHPDDDVDWW